MVRKIMGVVLAMVLVAVLAPHARAQDAVSLRLMLAQGDVLSYAFSNRFTQSIEVGRFRQSVDVRSEGREVHRVVEAGTDGSVLIDVAFEDVAFTVNGNTAHPAWPAIQMRVQADGTVVGETPCGCGPSSYSIPLPQDPVGAGTSWTRSADFNEDGLVINGTTTYTVVAIEQTPDGRIARIHSSTAGKVVQADLGPLPQEVQAGPIRGDITGDGDAVWSIDRGRLLSMREHLGVQLQMEMTVQGEPVRLTMRMDAAGQRELGPSLASASRQPLRGQGNDPTEPAVGHAASGKD